VINKLFNGEKYRNRVVYHILETCCSSEIFGWLKITLVLNFARKSESGHRPVGPASVILSSIILCILDFAYHLQHIHICHIYHTNQYCFFFVIIDFHRQISGKAACYAAGKGSAATSKWFYKVLIKKFNKRTS